KMKTKDITTPNLRKSIGRSPLRLGLPRVQRIWIIRGFFLIPLVLVCFALPSTVQATSDCTHYLVQDGCNALHLNDGMRAMFYDTAIGAYALYSNSGGGNQNSAFGAYSLYSNTTGTYNTAVGYRSLNNNTDGDYNTATGSFALTLNNHGG